MLYLGLQFYYQGPEPEDVCRADPEGNALARLNYRDIKCVLRYVRDQQEGIYAQREGLPRVLTPPIHLLWIAGDLTTKLNLQPLQGCTPPGCSSDIPGEGAPTSQVLPLPLASAL